MLDPWTAARVQQPARAYEKFVAGGQKPFAFTNTRLSEFRAPSETEGVSKRYAEILRQQKLKYQDWVLSPSKYEPEAKEPLCMGRRTKSFNAGSVQGVGSFGHGQHTPWEEFQHNLSKPQY